MRTYFDTHARAFIVCSTLASFFLLSSAGYAADPPSDVRATAEALYQEAYKLNQAGHFSEACKKLEESDKLDPATGTKVELAKCYEKTGRPASAWAMYVTAADADKLSGKNKAREAEARERAEALFPDLPRMIVNVPASLADLPDLLVERDGITIGKATWGTPQPVDLGEHVVRVQAKGKRDWEGKTTALARSTVTLSVPEALEDDPTARGSIGTDKPIAKRDYRIPAFVAFGVGAGSLIAGGVFGGLAFKQWGEVEDSAGSNCIDPTAFTGCSTTLQTMGDRASTYATISTITFAVGGAATAAGVVLWLLSSSGSDARAQLPIVVPQAGPSQAGLMMVGRF